MGVRRMAGTPWHVEVLHKSENDERRHKARCSRNNRGYCTFYSSNCKGSSHCRYYQDVNDIDIKEMNDKSIGLNSRVKLYELSQKEHLIVTLVKGSGDISEASGYKISMDSALAQKLIGCKVGSTVEVNGYSYQVIGYW